MCTGYGAKSEDIYQQFRFHRHLQGREKNDRAAAGGDNVQILIPFVFFYFRVVQLWKMELLVLHSPDSCLLLCLVVNLYEEDLFKGFGCCLVCDFSGSESSYRLGYFRFYFLILICVDFYRVARAVLCVRVRFWTIFG